MFNIKKKKINISYLLVFFLPISFLIGSFFSNLTTILLSIFYIFHLIKKRELFIILEKQYYLLFLLFFVFFISSLDSKYVLYGIENSVAYLLNIFLFLGLSLYYFNEKNVIDMISKLVSILILFICFDCWLQFISGENILGYSIQQAGRLTSIFKEEQIPGSVVFTLSPFLVYFLFKNQNNNIISKYRFLILIFVYFSILITAERSASIITTLLAVTLIIFNFKKINKNNFLFFLSIFIIVFSSLYFQKNSVIKERISYTFYQINNNNIYFPMYEKGYKIFTNNKLTGTGPQSFRHECYKVTNSGNYCSSHPHNYVIELLSDTGIFSLIIFLFGITKLVFFKISRVKDTFLKSVIFSYPILFFFPFLPTGSFFNSFHMSLIWFSLGFIFSIKKF